MQNICQIYHFYFIYFKDNYALHYKSDTVERVGFRRKRGPFYPGLKPVLVPYIRKKKKIKITVR